MRTATHIEDYGLFSSDIVDTLNGVAERLGQLSYGQAIKEFKVPEPRIFQPAGFRPIEVLDVIPSGGYDQALVIQAEMTSGIDPSLVMHLIPIIGSLPMTRIVVSGKPTRWGNSYNLLTAEQARKVSSGDFSPLAIPTLQYLHSNPYEPVTSAIHAGFSLGGDVVPEIPRHAADYGHQVQAVISVDGVTGIARPLSQLGHDFLRAQRAWRSYAHEVENPAYAEARRGGHNNSVLFVLTSLLRRSSLAIASGLSKGGMERRLRDSLAAVPSMKAIIFNLGDSELSDNIAMNEIRQRLQSTFGPRVLGKALGHLKHGVNDQIYANAAIMLQGLKLTKG